MDDELIEESTPDQDYKTMLDIKAGYRPLDFNMKTLTSNCNYYNKNQNIKLANDLVEYCTYLANLEFEEIDGKREMEYIDAKTVHLRYTERLVV